MTETRRRNMKPDNCRACGKGVDANAGYLYRDTHGRPNRYTGKFGWFVKCEACHAGKDTRASVKAAANAATQPPAPKSWSIATARTWRVERGEHEGDVTVWLTGAFGRDNLGFRDPINSRFSGYTGYSLQQHLIADRPLSKAAHELLSPQVLAIITAVQKEEQASGETALARLTAVGATAGPLATGYGWRVHVGQGTYYLWGSVGGGYTLNGNRPGEPNRDWTIEELINNP